MLADNDLTSNLNARVALEVVIRRAGRHKLKVADTEGKVGDGVRIECQPSHATTLAVLACEPFHLCNAIHKLVHATHPVQFAVHLSKSLFKNHIKTHAQCAGGLEENKQHDACGQ